jgi:hypothetical protein
MDSLTKVLKIWLFAEQLHVEGNQYFHQQGGKVLAVYFHGGIIHGTFHGVNVDTAVA